ncbi:MAG: aminotransferase class I/II-fold pyridoxal phosphate-dependent enzyme [Planctomycetota bacterium]|jgi:methionine-gamma-lyase|nr:aminotransferase class I/II-fold pyridoxal phosphate-dependent enzyme [Planctomycetota bacterium]
MTWDRPASRLIHNGDGRFQLKLAASASLPETFPIYLTSVFAFTDPGAVDDIYEKRADGYIYSRLGSPNADAAAAIMAAAEESEDALVFSSGMAAITTAILSLVRAGDHIISSPAIYGGVHDFFANELKRFGVEVSFTGPDGEGVVDLARPSTRLIYTEMISNPLMRVPDIARLADAAGRLGIPLVVDNTFATPAVAKVLDLGADLAVYSATKYLGGHSDILAGAVPGSRERLDGIRRLGKLYGNGLGAVESWLLARSLRTLDIRMARHSENGLKTALFLESHPKVEKVFYPGLASSPSHSAAVRQFPGGRFGGMLSFNLRGGETEATGLIRALDGIPFAPSLAGAATTLSYSIKTSHRFYSRKELAEAGITASQIRLSAGLEDAADILAVLEEGLSRI